jgi:branched-chain amino acid transport system substrate-binding protein
MLLALGTPMNLAAFKQQDAKKIPNIVPLSAARQMLQEPVDYKFVSYSSYYDQIKDGIKYLSEKNGAKTVCAMYLPSDFGLEIKEGAADQAKALNLKYGDETTHKPDETDFAGSLTKLKGAGCDLVALALSVRQTITAVATAKKIGWTNVTFLTSSAGFHTAIAQAPGGVSDGLYAVAGWSDIVARIETTPELKEWVGTYKAATGEEPGTGALLGRDGAGLMERALEAAGKDLTPDTLKTALEGLSYESKISDNALAFSPKSHQGSKTSIISVVKSGNWAEIGRGTAP